MANLRWLVSLMLMASAHSKSALSRQDRSLRADFETICAETDEGPVFVDTW
jgi:hypothetical protein